MRVRSNSAVNVQQEIPEPISLENVPQALHPQGLCRSPSASRNSRYTFTTKFGSLAQFGFTVRLLNLLIEIAPQTALQTAAILSCFLGILLFLSANECGA
jgi:putative copper export protein